MNYSLKKILFLLSISLFVSCQGDDGEDGYNSLISTQIELPGANCEAGGIIVNHGIDLNRNGNLESSEILDSDFICNGQNGDIFLDNLVRLGLGSPDLAGCGKEWTTTQFESWQLQDFNKLDYANVSSILFVPSLSTADVGNSIVAELFNVTDNIPIEGSQVSLNASEGIFKFRYSQNIYSALPSYPITLSIRLKNTTNDGCGSTGTYSYLYILRE